MTGHPEPPGLDAWQPWTPRAVAARLAGLRVPWCVAGGWALDLHLGRQTRQHHDLEIAVPADAFPEVAACLPGCAFAVPLDGGLHPATAEALRAGHQTWVWERSTRLWRLDVFREPVEAGTWIFRRDRRIRRRHVDVIEHDTDGIPYLAPEIVLLFKSAQPRAQDEADLRGALAHLGPARSRWLAGTLALTRAGHPWLAVLDPDPGGPEPG